MFSKSHTTIWSYKFYKITEITEDTISSSRLDKLPERCNEILHKKTNLTIKEKKRDNERKNLN